jgi:hypothetical protein
VFDTRSDNDGAGYDGNTIQMVDVLTGEVKKLYQSENAAHCGVVAFHPRDWKVSKLLKEF